MPPQCASSSTSMKRRWEKPQFGRVASVIEPMSGSQTVKATGADQQVQDGGRNGALRRPSTPPWAALRSRKNPPSRWGSSPASRSRADGRQKPCVASFGPELSDYEPTREKPGGRVSLSSTWIHRWPTPSMSTSTSSPGSSGPTPDGVPNMIRSPRLRVWPGGSGDDGAVADHVPSRPFLANFAVHSSSQPSVCTGVFGLQKQSGHGINVSYPLARHHCLSSPC